MTMKTMQLILLKAIFVTVITVGPIGIAHAFQAEARVAPPSSTAAPALSAVAPLTTDQLNSLALPSPCIPMPWSRRFCGAAAFPE
jgi:hypothetical protein